MTTYTIGYHREDGDFAILATLNNNDGHMGHNTFADLVERTRFQIANFMQPTPIVSIERQDAPDYIDLGETA
jgi:hypothetical protein